MARNPNTPTNTAPPAVPGTPGTFYSLVGHLPDGTAIYQNAEGRMFTQGGGGSWVPYDGPAPTGAPVSTPPGTGPRGIVGAPPAGGGGGGGGGTLGNPGGSLIEPFPEVFTPPANAPIPGAPEFHPPEFTKGPEFKVPTYADVQNEPGYAFARDEGLRSIEHSKAARGIYNTPGTLKELARFNTGLADQTYGNVFNRAQQTYGTNYQTQYLDPYKFAYQSALDTFNPQFSAWQTNAAATQRGNEFNYGSAFDRYKFDYQRWLDRINTSTGIASL